MCATTRWRRWPRWGTPSSPVARRCACPQGPGALNLVNGLNDAKIEGAPVTAVTGMTYHDMVGTRFLQDLNQDYLFNDACAFNQRVDGPAHAINATDLAVRAALAQRAASRLAISIDVQSWEVEKERISDKNIPGHTSITNDPYVTMPRRRELERAAAALRQRRKVAIIAGAGARGAATSLKRWPRSWAPRSPRPPWARTVFPTTLPTPRAGSPSSARVHRRRCWRHGMDS